MNINKLKETVYITGHQNSDVDSIVSVWLMERIFHNSGIETVKILPGGNNNISSSTLRAIDYLGINLKDFQEYIPEGSSVFQVDFYDLTMENVIGCIDHHPAISGFSISDKVVIQSCSSNALLIYKTFPKFKWTEQDLEAITVATIMDTMYLTSKKTNLNEINLLRKLGMDVDKICNDVKSFAIEYPDFTDIFQNPKEYSIKYDDEDLEGYRKFQYLSIYIEMNNENIGLEDIPMEYIKEQMTDYGKSVLFSVYDYVREQTAMFLYADFLCDEHFEFITEYFDHIASRGTELRPYIKDKLVPSFISKKIDEIIEECMIFFDEHEDLRENSFASIYMATTLRKTGLTMRLKSGFYQGKKFSWVRFGNQNIYYTPENGFWKSSELLDGLREEKMVERQKDS